jgi:hypothetical protein
VVGFTTGSRGKVPGETCEKRRINNNNNLLLLLLLLLVCCINSQKTSYRCSTREDKIITITK